MTIVNDDSRVITKLETSLTDNERVIIYYRHKFIVQATSLTFVNGTGPYLYEKHLVIQWKRISHKQSDRWQHLS